MADLKISELTNLTAADPANDMIPIVDVSATPPASGSTKRISINNILACSPTATLASATISGDLTVDTSTLKVDSANNWVGVGTATPAVRLHSNVADAAEAARFSSTSALLRFHPYVDATDKTRIQATNGTNTGLSDLTLEGLNLRFNTNGGLAYAISNIGVSTWSVGGSTAMTLNATGLGVGSSPQAKLHVSNGATIDSGLFTGLMIGASVAGSARSASIIKDTSTPYNLIIRTQDFTGGTTGSFIVRNGSTDQFQIDSSGNVGIGVTPAGTGGCLQLKSGITFPATQVASSDANTLDDYEEGTFTPTVIGSSTAGTATYATQSGRYVKIGRQVTAWIHLDWSGGTGTGNLRFGGLPFTIITLATNNYPSAAIGYINGIALSANNIAVAYGQNAENAVNLGQYPIGGGSGSSVAYDAAGQIIFTITYEV